MFEILKSELMYTGRAFKVQRVTARMPNGKERFFDLVDHASSVTLIPVTAAGEILMIRQYRIGTAQMLLELPAGVLDEGENPLDGARRELREETGMDARVLKELGAAYLSPGYCNEYMHFILAREISESPLDPDEDEFMAMEVYPVAEVYRMARAGEIHDSKSLAALLLAQAELL